MLLESWAPRRSPNAGPGIDAAWWGWHGWCRHRNSWIRARPWPPAGSPFVEGADAVEALAHAQLGHGLPGMNQPAPEFRGPQNALRVHFEIAEQHRRAETRAPSAIDMETNVDLLVHRYRSRIPDRRSSGKRPLLSSSLRWLVTAGSSCLSLKGWPNSRRAALTSCPRLGGSLTFPDTDTLPMNQLLVVMNLTMTPPLYGSASTWISRVASGGEKPLDAGAHHGNAQRLIALQRQNFEELGALQRLLPRARTGY